MRLRSRLSIGWLGVLCGGLAVAAPVERAVEVGSGRIDGWLPSMTRTLLVSLPKAGPVDDISPRLDRTLPRRMIEPSLRERLGAAAEPSAGLSGFGIARQFDRSGAHLFQAPDLYRARLSVQTGTFSTPGAAEQGEARLISPRLSIASSDTSRYLDLGYTEAEYAIPAPGATGLKLRQFAPSLGFSLQEPGDWLTLRLYDVRSPDTMRGQGPGLRTRAIETKLVRTIEPADGRPNEFQVSALFGNRMHAVDPDSASIFSLADMQTGGVSFGAVWKLAPNFRVLLSGGYDRFERGASAGGGEYSSTYVFTGLKGRW